jgi:hypothetical protein
MKNNFLTGLAMTFAVILASCSASTRITSSWRDPGVSIDTNSIHRFIVAALLKNQSIRRQVEDNMVALFPGKAVQSYKEFGMDSLKENDDVYNQRLKSEGYDGFVVMRLVDVQKQQYYVPGNYPAYYGNWRGFWMYSWTGFYDPGYYQTDKNYEVEVTVYSLKRNKLIWTATTNTINPRGGVELFGNVSKVIYKKMEKEGFLK